MNKMRDFVKFYNSIQVDKYIEKDVDAIYHYTSPMGFAGIVENSTLRFTDRFYLNDKSEGIYVLELCAKNMDVFDFLSNEFKEAFLKSCNERLINPQRDRFFVYQCSFSTDKDSLCLWNYYTKADGIKGYNLEFVVQDLEKMIHPKLRDDKKIPNLRYGKVIYEEKKQFEILSDIIYAFFEYSKEDKISGLEFVCDYLVDKIQYLGTFFKKPCFNVEKEFRLAYDLYLEENNTYVVIQDKQRFYEKNGIYIPYVDLNFDEKILTGVGISPTLDYKATKESILRVMGTKYSNINHKSIYESGIPVRY